jgi:hypothetical protein
MSKPDFNQPTSSGTLGRGISSKSIEDIKIELNAIKEIIDNNQEPFEKQKSDVCDYLNQYPSLREDYKGLWHKCRCSEDKTK